MSSSVSEEVSTTTGRLRRPSVSRIRFSTPKPSTLGSFRSRSTISGRPALPLAPLPTSRSMASAPSRATTMGRRKPALCNAKTASSSSSWLSSTSRTNPFRFPMLLRGTRFSRRSWNSEQKRRSLAGGALGPDAPAVAVHDPLHGGQTDARAFALAGRVPPLEGAEQLVGVGHVEPRAVVAHKKDRLGIALLRGDLQPRVGALGGELPGVADQVLQHRLHERRIRADLDARLDLRLHFAVRLGLAEAGQDPVRQRVPPYRPCLDRLAAHPRP